MGRAAVRRAVRAHETARHDDSPMTRSGRRCRCWQSSPSRLIAMAPKSIPPTVGARPRMSASGRVVADLELVQQTAAERALQIEDPVHRLVGDFDDTAADAFRTELAAAVAEQAEIRVPLLIHPEVDAEAERILFDVLEPLQLIDVEVRDPVDAPGRSTAPGAVKPGRRAAIAGTALPTPPRSARPRRSSRRHRADTLHSCRRRTRDPS